MKRHQFTEFLGIIVDERRQARTRRERKQIDRLISDLCLLERVHSRLEVVDNPRGLKARWCGRLAEHDSHEHVIEDEHYWCYE